jgi:hypothetical protein
MNMAMTLTVDALIRALRWRADDLADDIERGYREDAPRSALREEARAGIGTGGREQSDDSAGR